MNSDQQTTEESKTPHRVRKTPILPQLPLKESCRRDIEQKARIKPRRLFQELTE
jgi:hypothetical protein